MKKALRLLSGTVLTIALLASARLVSAQTTWQNGGDSLWDNPANWDNGVPTSGSLALFDLAGSTTVDLGGASRDLLSLIFNSGAQGYTFSGNAGDKLNFDSAGSIAASSGMTAAQTINSAIGLNGGAFTITNDDTTNLLTLGGGVSLTSGAAGLLTVNGAGNTTLNGAIAASTISGLAKSGTGTLTLGAANSYTGTTTITEGTITTSGGDGRIGTGGLVFGNNTSPAAATAATTLGTLNLAGSESVASLAVATNSLSPNILTIGAGKTLTVNGAFTVGLVGADTNTGLTADGGGTLAINNSAGSVNIGGYGTGTTGFNATVDLKALAAFTANVTNFNLGAAGAPVRTIGAQVSLSNTTNTITTTNFTLNDTTTPSPGTGAQLTGSISNLFLGDGTNTINTDTLVVGQGNGRGIISFQSASGSLALNGKAGAGSKVAITLGNKTGGGTATPLADLNLAGHTATVNASSLTIGKVSATATGTRGADGSLEFGGGTFNVDTIDMANKAGVTTGPANADITVSGGSFAVANGLAMSSIAASSGGDSTANLNLSGGSFTVNGGAFTVGSVGNQTVTRTSTATLNITGGIFTSNVNILRGSVGTNGVINSTITLDGGTLNMTGKNIGSSTNPIGVLNFRAGTLSNVGQINAGTTGLTKTTAGVLNLTGNNDFTGPIAVNQGTLNLLPSETHSLNTGSLTTAASTVLGITPFSTSSTALITNGVTLGGGTVNISLVGNPSIALVNSTGALTLNGANTVNLSTTAPLSTGIYPLIDYAGSLLGAGTISLGSVPLRASGSIQNNLGNTSIDLHLTADSIRWEGGVVGFENIWDINTTANWKEIGSGNSTTYLEPSSPGEPVTFNDDAVGNFAIDVPNPVNPVSMTFSNNDDDYSFGGAGIAMTVLNVTGAGAIDFNNSTLNATTAAMGGSGTTTFNSSTGTSIGTLNFTGSGDVAVTGGNFAVTGTLTKGGAGTLELSNSGATLSLSPSVTVNGGTVAFNRTDDLIGAATITSSITGTGGTLLKQNTNVVALSGNNGGFNGTADVEVGTLRIAGPTALTSTNVQNDATLQFDLGVGGSTTPGVGGTKAVSIIGNGVGGNGAILVAPTSGTADVNAHIGALTLNGDARIAATNNGGTGAARLFVDGAITGGGFNLEAFVNRNSNAGNEMDFVNNGATNLNNVTITGNGALYIGKNTNLGATGEIILGDGSTGGQIGLYSGASPDALSVAFNKPIKVAASSVGGIPVWFNPDQTVGSSITIDGTRLDVIPYVRNSVEGKVTLTGDITGAGGLGVHVDTSSSNTARTGLVQLVSDNNTYAGPTTIGGGGGIAGTSATNDRITLSIGSGGATGSIGSGTISIIAPPTADTSAVLALNRSGTYSLANTINTTAVGGSAIIHAKHASGDVTLSGVISGGGQVLVSGGSLLTLANTNSYTGGSTITQGTLATTADGALGSGPVLIGHATTPTITTGNLNLGGNETVSSLTVGTNSATANTITIASGKTLTVSGSGGLTVGTLTASTTNNLTVSGGTLAVSNTSANVNFGRHGNPASSATIDLTGLAAFTANVNEFNVSKATTAERTWNTSVFLSNTTNTITANSFTINDTAGNNVFQPATLRLGEGSNIINTDTLVLGRGRGDATMGFVSTAPGPGTLTLGGKSTSKVNITVGDTTAGGGTGATSTLELRGHTSNVTAGVLTIGSNSGAGAGSLTGRLRFNTGTFMADHVNLGPKSGTGAGQAQGIIEFSGGNFTVNPDATPGFGVTLGSQADAGPSRGTLNVTGGIFSVNGDILQGPITGSGTIVSNITVGSAGTLNTVGTGGVGAIAIGTGAGATGTFTVDGGSVHASGPIQMGLLSGGEGTFVMNGGTVTCDDWVVIGTFGGTGHGTQHGGTINTVNFDVAQDIGSSGDYTMDNANGASQIIASGFFAVGDGGTGTFDLNAGTTSSGGWTYVGAAGNGTFNIGDGTHTAGDNFYMGGAEGAVGNVNMTTSSNAVINITGNAVPYTGNLVVGDHGSGNLTVSSGTINMNASNTTQNTLNSATTSVANHSGDPLNYLDDARDGNLSIAEEEGTGIVNLSDTGVINVAANVFVGGFNTHDDQANYLRGGVGTLNISGGALHVGTFSGAGSTGGDLVLGSPDAITTATGFLSQAYVTLSGGLLDVAHGTGSIVSGGAANTSFTFMGGTLKVKVWNPTTEIGGDLGNLVQHGSGSLLDVTGNNTTINGSYDLGEGTATVGAGRTMTANSVLNSFGAGVINVGTGAGFPTGDHNQNAVVDAADYVLWRMTPGAFPDGYNTWRGNFGATGGGGPASLTVGGGTIAVDTLNLNNGSVTATGGVSIETKLAGNGTINGSVVMADTAEVSPGLSAGKLTFANDLTLGSNGLLTIEIDGAAPVTGYDQLAVGGVLDIDGESFIGGTLQVNLNFTPAANSLFNILDFASLTGTFNAVNFSAGTWDQSQLYSDGILKYLSAGSGMFNGSAVPEPSAWALVAMAVFSLVGRRPVRCPRRGVCVTR